MGFIRKVSLVCDGPCGKILEGHSKAAEGWVKMEAVVYQVLAEGQKPTHPRYIAWLCPDCWESARILVTSHHFDLSQNLSAWKEDAQ